jgi:hypothetical protein
MDGVIEVPVGRLPFTPLPSGLLWLNVVRAALPLRPWPTNRPLVVFYLHPFDLYPVRYAPHYSWTVNLWYLLRKKHVDATLELYVRSAARHAQFVQMRDLLERDWTADM